MKYLIGFLGRLLEILHTYLILLCAQRYFLQRNTGCGFPSQKALICLSNTSFKRSFVYICSSIFTSYVTVHAGPLACIFKFLNILLVTFVLFFQSSDQYSIIFVHNWLNMASSYFSSLISIKICKSILLVVPSRIICVLKFTTVSLLKLLKRRATFSEYIFNIIGALINFSL